MRGDTGTGETDDRDGTEGAERERPSDGDAAAATRSHYRVLGVGREGRRYCVRVDDVDYPALAERAVELERLVEREGLDAFEAQLRRAELSADLADELGEAIGSPVWVAGGDDALQPGYRIVARTVQVGEGPGGIPLVRFDGPVEVDQPLRLHVHPDCPPLSLLDDAYERLRTGGSNTLAGPGIALPFDLDGEECGTIVVTLRTDREGRDVWGRVRSGREGLLEQHTTDVDTAGTPREVSELFLLAPRNRPFIGLVVVWDTAAGRTAGDRLRTVLEE